MNLDFVDILLIQCPPWDFATPPLGINYLSSYLKKYLYRVSMFDLNITLYNLVNSRDKYLWEQKNNYWWVEDKLFEKVWDKLKKATIECICDHLKNIRTNHIGLSVNYSGICFTSELIKIIKDTDSTKKIVIGGWGCITEQMRSLFPKELVDVFVIGEGEETIREVLEVFRGYRSKSEVCGAIFNDGNQDRCNTRTPIMDLDIIPWPNYNDIDLSMYKYRILPLLTSRGCISNCSFCNDSPLSKPYRFRSAYNVFDEIKYHVKINQITQFAFKDLLCNGNIEQLDSLCRMVINSGLKISWDSQAIPRREMNYKFLCRLKKSGCGALIYGVESFSDNVLKYMRKLSTKNTAEMVIRDTYRAGINVYINIIVGFPGETEDDFMETYETIKRVRKYITEISAVSVCLINNNSALDKHYKDYGIIMPLSVNTRAKKWISADGKNTYEVRKARAEKILDLMEHIGLTYQTITI
jgi:anaerobic magnesium-protoporphyrin IX monomethyl ester cyclase